MRKCVDSLLQQDIPHEDYEIILVDDGGPDNSVDIAKEYATKHPNIVVLSQPNQGTSGARNTGIRHARGKYLYFVDPDDYILENSLSDILAQMDREDLDALRFGYIMVDENYREIRKGKDTTDYSPKLMSGDNFIAKRLGMTCFVWSYIFRTKIIQDNELYCTVGFYFDDADWTPAVLRKCKRVNSVNVKRHFYLIREGSLVNTSNPVATRKKLEGSFDVISRLQTCMKCCDSPQVNKWYKRMIDSTAMNILSSIVLSFYSERKIHIQRLCDMGVFPIGKYTDSKKWELYRRIANFSPEMLCVCLKWIYKIRKIVIKLKLLR